MRSNPHWAGSWVRDLRRLRGDAVAHLSIGVGDAFWNPVRVLSEALGDRSFVSLDSGVVADGLDHGGTETLLGMLAGRSPLVTPPVLEEYVAGPPYAKLSRESRAEKLFAFLTATSGGVGPMADPVEVLQVEGEVDVLARGRRVDDRDLMVMASTRLRGPGEIPILTVDKKFWVWGRLVGWPMERYPRTGEGR